MFAAHDDSVLSASVVLKLSWFKLWCMNDLAIWCPKSSVRNTGLKSHSVNSDQTHIKPTNWKLALKLSKLHWLKKSKLLVKTFLLWYNILQILFTERIVAFQVVFKHKLINTYSDHFSITFKTIHLSMTWPEMVRWQFKEKESIFLSNKYFSSCNHNAHFLC